MARPGRPLEQFLRNYAPVVGQHSEPEDPHHQPLTFVTAPMTPSNPIDGSRRKLPAHPEVGAGMDSQGAIPGRDSGPSDPGFVRVDQVHKADLSSEGIKANMWAVTAMCERGAVCASCVVSFSGEGSFLTRGAAYTPKTMSKPFYKRE